MTITLQKKINLVKKVLEEKKISDIKGQVVLALDISVSMSNMFSNGTVQDVVERLLAIGVNMDLDRQIDVHLFGAKAHVAESATLNNIDEYVKKKIQNKYRLESSTMYADVIRNIAKQHIDEVPQQQGFFGKMFGSKQKEVVTEAKPPVIVFFVTDGENFDQPATTKLIQELSKKGIFWQFIGIGSHSFKYLTHLDEMPGRYLDNANFFEANDIKNISDNALYDRILGELPDWIEEARSKGVVK